MQQIFGALVVLLMLFCLFGSIFASYSGVGLASSDPSVRQGSLGGIWVLGGGPGSGK